MANWFEHLLSRGLSRAAVKLTDEEQRQSSISRWFRRLRLFTRLLCFGYVLLLLAVWLLMKHVGEANITLAFLLYAPQSIWLLPLPVLGVIALILDWPSVLVVVASIALCIFGFLGVKLTGPTATQAKTLTVLTFNRGENAGTSMQPFKNVSKPDVIVLQDATGKSRGYVKSQGYEEFGFGDDVGEFSIVSKFPVTSKELISHQGTPVAARFTLDWEGRSVVVYTLHLPTPRQTLASLKRGAFLWGILPGGTAARKQESYESFFRTHFDITRMVVERVEAETLPTLLAGDFNASATGSLHQLATRKLHDAHEAAGQGAGFTFPGTTHNPLSLGGPWMRLDKLMCNDGWQPVSCIAEPDRASQHRAVTAAFALMSAR